MQMRVMRNAATTNRSADGSSHDSKHYILSNKKKCYRTNKKKFSLNLCYILVFLLKMEKKRCKY